MLGLLRKFGGLFLVVVVLLIRPPIVAAQGNAQQGFSRQFMQAGITAVAALRSWMNNVVFTVQNGFPISGNWIFTDRDRAAEAVNLAAVAASKPEEQQASALLQNELDNVQGWAEDMIGARLSLNAQLAVTPGGVENSAAYQQILACVNSLNAMFASGALANASACSQPSNLSSGGGT